jgi:hypothetical protein
MRAWCGVCGGCDVRNLQLANVIPKLSTLPFEKKPRTFNSNIYTQSFSGTRKEPSGARVFVPASLAPLISAAERRSG